MAPASTPSIHPNAPELVELARVFAGVVKPPLEQKFPELFGGGQADQWTFFCTVACTWTACVSLHHCVTPDQRTQNELVVQRSLADWHPAAIAAYEDLHRFVIDKLPKGNDKAQRREILELSVGTWIVWNVTDKAKLANEFEIISAVASLVAREFTGYWQQQL